MPPGNHIQTKHFPYSTALLLFFFLAGLYSQSLNIRVYNVQDGLSQSEVNTIDQAPDRSLWLGTSSGLSIFDGKTFSTIMKSDGLAGEDILSSVMDDEGYLWLGHYNGGITRIDTKTRELKTYQLSPNQGNNIENEVYRIFLDSKNNLWFITYKQGIFLKEKDSSSVKKYSNVETYDACIDNDDRLWYTNLSNVYSLDTRSGKLDSLELNGVVKTEDIICIFCDHRGIIWLGSGNNTLLYLDNLNSSENKTPVKIKLKQEKVSFNIINITEDKNGILWLNTYYGGVIKFDPATRRNKKPSFTLITSKNGLSLDNTTTTFMDIEGNYWIGTPGGGLCKYRDDSFKLYRQKEGLTDNLVWNITKDSQNHIWIACDEGLNLYLNPGAGGSTPDIKAFMKIQDKYLITVLVLYEDQYSFLWGSFLDGVFRINLKNNHFDFYKLNAKEDITVSAINEDKKGNLLFGTLQNGLYRFDRKNSIFKHFEKDSINKNAGSTIFKNRNGDLWIGGEGNHIYKLTDKGLFNIKTPFNMIMDIDEDPDGNLWVLSNESKIYKYDGFSFTKIKLGLEDKKETIYSILCENPDEIWLGMTFGILRFNHKTGEYSHYGKLDGFSILESNQGAVYRTDKGKLWFGTTDGLLEINSGVVKKNSVSPTIKISSIDLFQKDTPLINHREFNYNENYLTLHFNGISLTAPEDVQYSYQLQGLDNEWSPESREDHITYTNLAPGDYIFRVKARNSEGLWNNNPAEFNFTILAPFWKTTWFIFLLAMVFIGVGYATHIQRMKKIKQRNTLLDNEVKKRTKELNRAKVEAEKVAKALQESESKFRYLTEMTSVAIFIYHKENFLYVNPAMEKITGYSREELLSMKFWDVVHPEYQELTKTRGMNRQAGEEVPSHYQFIIVRKNGRECWVEFIAKQIIFEGKPSALGTAMDISNIKKVEEELTDQKEQLAVTLRSIGDGVITTNTAGNIQLMNQAAEDITGWLQDEVLNRPFSEIFITLDKKTGKISEDPLTSFIKNNDFSNFEAQAILLNKNKHEIIIAEKGAPIRNNDGDVLGYVVVFRDIGENLKLQDEILKTQKLDSIGVLAGGLAHDFNNILTAITGNISLATLHAKNDETLKSILSEMEFASARAQDITMQLLTFSKGGAPVKETTSIKEIISESINFTLRGSAVACKYVFPEDLWPVNIDTGQVSQVIQNLTLNSLQAMPKGGRIQITTTNVEIGKNGMVPVKPGKYIQIKFKDEGSGIPPDTIDKIFDPYFTTKQRGVGLGLASVYSIIKKHDGHIEVNTKAKAGTTFIIYLPAAFSPRRKNSKDKETVPDDLKSKKILFMDDEEIVQNVARKMLEEMGYSVTVCSDGEEAIQIYKKSMSGHDPFDVVILDLTIPGGMGGKTTMEMLKSIDIGAVGIVISGYSNDDVLANFQNYGFSARIKKPFNINDLRMALNQVFSS